MVTQGVTVTNTTWLNIITEFTLTNGTRYNLQNVGSRVLFLTEQSSTPTDATPAHEILPGESRAVTPEAGMGLWVRGYLSSVDIAITESE